MTAVKIADGGMMALPAMLQALSPERRRRRQRRTQIAAPADVAQGDEAFAVTILDFSETGFRARSASELRTGSWVKLKLDALTAPEARVKWRNDDEYGFEFAFPLFPEFVAAALSGATAEFPGVGTTAREVFPVANEPAPYDPADVHMSWTDYRARQCRVAGEMIALTPLMAEAMSVLLMRRGEVVSGGELARAVWPEGGIDRGRMATLQVTVCNLKNRLPGIVTSPSRGNYSVPQTRV